MIRISTKVVRSIGFLTGLLILMVVLSAIFAPKREIYNATAVDEKQRSLKEEPEDTIDVIFAGDSESYSAFSSRRSRSRCRLPVCRFGRWITRF